MKRRSFLRRLGAAVVGLTLARELPGIAVAPPVVPKPEHEPAIAIRMVRQFDIDQGVTRFDILYGFGTIRPDLGVRIVS